MAFSPFDTLTQRGDVPNMVENPITAAEREEILGELRRLDAATTVLQGIGLQDMLGSLMARSQTIWDRIHRAKPLAQRRGALASAIARREAALTTAQAAKEMAEAVLAAALATTRSTDPTSSSSRRS